jgi:hypothetical protein
LGAVVTVLDSIAIIFSKRRKRKNSFAAMYRTTNIKTKAGLFLLALACSATGLGTGSERVYMSGYSATMKLGGELHDALPQKFFDQLDAQTIALQPQDFPLISPVATSDENHLQRQVELSAGFIDLVNHLCHAKAIDKIQPGYFAQYVGILAHSCAADPAAPLPPILEPRYWSEDIVNDQLGYFNQMMGTMMAISMSHHYLGHYAKYAARLAGPGDKIGAINDLLTPAEWEVSVKAGALDALNCALSTDGLRVMFDALDIMPTRPQWAAYIAPQHADLKKLNKELARYEEDFFHGRIRN